MREEARNLNIDFIWFAFHIPLFPRHVRCASRVACICLWTKCDSFYSLQLGNLFIISRHLRRDDTTQLGN